MVTASTAAHRTTSVSPGRQDLNGSRSQNAPLNETRSHYTFHATVQVLKPVLGTGVHSRVRLSWGVETG
jgi:hypothetical protein